MLFCLLVFGNAMGQNVIITEINYNNPGSGTDSLEFVELYNKGQVAVNLSGWEFVSGVSYTFPTYDLNPGEYVVVAYSASKFNQAFGFTPLEWENTTGLNALNNTSENIILVNADSMFVDSVRYADNTPWPSAADGQGPSLVLCDYDSDNGDASNWALATTGSGFVIGGIEVLANPGAASGCSSSPVVSFSFPAANVPESAGDVFVSVSINGGNANPTAVTVSVNPSSTASASDYSATFPMTLTFAGGAAAETQTLTIPIINDTDIEANETLVLDITNTTNGAIVGTGTFSLSITDDDTPLTGALLISGVFDAQPGATGAKGVELKALADIPDLSIYGVGSASNGGGSDGVEITLPVMSLSEGECVYVAANDGLFTAYFGLTAIATGDGVSINGDDAIELFENGQVIDVYGDINYPTGTGSTLPWYHVDGWAYRKDGTGPDGILFDITHWNIHVDALDGGTDNTTAPLPFPVCDYSPIPPMTAELVDDEFTIPSGAAANLNVLANDLLPTTITSLGLNTFPTNGVAEINGLVDIIYTPNDGFCGTDVFSYEVCDNGGCDVGTVTVIVDCPDTYPLYDIADVTTVTGGQPDSLGITCELRGIVYGIDYQGVTLQGDPVASIQFYLNDGQGGSISVFGTDSFGYSVQEGDEVSVRGEIVSFNCLSQIGELDTIMLLSSNNPILAPTPTTTLNESLESELVRFTNRVLVNPAQWGPQTPTATGFNVLIRSLINPSADTVTMRIDNDCPWFTMPAPTVPFHATGLVGQFVAGGGGGCVDGYQFLPRYVSDIELLSPTDESVLAGKINFFPNPVGSELFLESELLIEDIIVANALGQQVLRVKGPSNSISVGQLEPGIYLITFQAAGDAWTSKFIKQ